jgi:hypothetical protein
MTPPAAPPPARPPVDAPAAIREIGALPGPRGLPLLGSLHRWDASRAHLILEQWAREHGPIYRFRLGPQSVVVISEADAMMSVLRERPHDFRRHFAVRPIFREMGIDGLFSAEGEDWRRQRPPARRSTWRWFRTRTDREIERSLAVAGRAVQGFIANARAEMARRPELRRAARTEAIEALAAEREDGSRPVALHEFDSTRGLPLIEGVVLERWCAS